ncbi:hypothetical protein NDU88_006292 [Pleurodeles waltl]|uniref:Myb-like domain-containing protein n=1 Tax=Pleurodeles waltl TaxID=8319 RepID=A0AAV7UKK2_PLEWA|nr:hypothetical protein NDU88_006292 [Pleurodeles waltl]
MTNLAQQESQDSRLPRHSFTPPQSLPPSGNTTIAPTLLAHTSVPSTPLQGPQSTPQTQDDQGPGVSGSGHTVQGTETQDNREAGRTAVRQGENRPREPTLQETLTAILGAYQHSQDTLGQILDKLQENMRLQEGQYLGIIEDLKDINNTLVSIAGVLTDMASTMRETVAHHQTPDISQTTEQPSTSAAASGQEAPPQEQHATSTPPPAEGEPPHKCSIKVSAHKKKGIWCAIAKDVRTLGVYGRQSTHCRKRWEDLKRWAWKTAEAQLGIASQRASSGRGAGAPAMDGAASHRTQEAGSTDGDGTSGTEGEESTTVETGGDSSDTDTSSDGSSLVVADTSVPTPATGVRGSRSPDSHTERVPAPSAARKGKEAPQAAARKGKEQSPAAAKRSKEPSPAAGRKGKGPAPAGRKDKRPGAGTQSEPPPPTMVVQPSEAAGDGLEPPPTTASTATAPPPAAAAPVGSRSRLQGKGWSLPQPLPAPPPAPLPAAAAPLGTRRRLQGKR